jgi:hypothetical protein
MHTLTLYARRCFFPRYTILGAGIQRCRTESNGLAFIGKNKVMGVDGKSIKSNAYFSILGRIGSAKFRKSSNAREREGESRRRRKTAGRTEEQRANISFAHRLQESYQNCCLSECVCLTGNSISNFNSVSIHGHWNERINVCGSRMNMAACGVTT